MSFVCFLREMCSQHNCWTCICKETYQEGEKWKEKRQFKAFRKYIKWSCSRYLGINDGMNRSLMLFDTQLYFLQIGGKKKREKKRNCIIWNEHTEEMRLQQWVLLDNRKPGSLSMLFYWVDKSSIICAAYTPVWDWCGNGVGDVAELSRLSQ